MKSSINLEQLCIIGVLAMVNVLFVQALGEISFYTATTCQGEKYTMSLGNGDCKSIPGWLSIEGLKLSVDPQGKCVKVFEKPLCKEYTSRIIHAYAFTGQKPLPKKSNVLRKCESIHGMSFQAIRSFRRVPC